MFGIMLKLGTNAAISSRGDSSKFTLVKRYLRNDNILVVSYTLCCINVNNNTQFSKNQIMLRSRRFGSNKCLQWKDTIELTRYFLEKKTQKIVRNW